MKTPIRIDYLKDHPHLIPDMEQLFNTQWSDYYGSGGLADAGTDIRSFSNKSKLPIGLVAIRENRYCGSITLRAKTESHGHLSPWLTAFVVAPEFRRRGIGSRLIQAAKSRARELGFEVLYARSSTAVSLFEKNGWVAFDRLAGEGETLILLRRDLQGSFADKQ